MSRHRFSSSIHIPMNWTAEQATAVIDLLDEISTVIWNLHDEKIIEEMRKNQILSEHAEYDMDDPDPLDDDIPF